MCVFFKCVQLWLFMTKVPTSTKGDKNPQTRLQERTEDLGAEFRVSEQLNRALFPGKAVGCVIIACPAGW